MKRRGRLLAEGTCSQDVDSFGAMVYVGKSEDNEPLLVLLPLCGFWGLHPVVRHNSLTVIPAAQYNFQSRQHCSLNRVVMNTGTICMEQGSHREPEIALVYKPTPIGAVSKQVLKMIKSHSVPIGSVWGQGKAF